MLTKFRDELIIIDVLTSLVVIITIFLPLDVLRLVLGLPAVLFFPGYVLLAALFPGRDALSGLERIALSLGLSITVVSLIGFILNYTWGVGLYPVLFSTALFIVVASAFALLQRRRLSPDERFSLPFNLRRIKGAEASRLDKRLAVGIVLALFLALGALGYAIATKDVGERFSEFYILGLDGRAEGYPKDLIVGQEAVVIVGIVNQEHEDTSYRFEVLVDGEVLKQVGPMKLAYEERWQRQIGFTVAGAGDNQKVEFYLYKIGENQPQSRLYLWVNVKSSR